MQKPDQCKAVTPVLMTLQAEKGHSLVLYERLLLQVVALVLVSRFPVALLMRGRAVVESAAPCTAFERLHWRSEDITHVAPHLIGQRQTADKC